MESPRSKVPPKQEQTPPVDFGGSSNPARRCKTCACSIEIKNPQKIGDSQTLCRRNGVNMMIQNVQGIAGPRQEVTLTYPPTQPDLVCFDGWRPLDTPPGDVPNSKWDSGQASE